jgi:hypothetical protein
MENAALDEMETRSPEEQMVPERELLVAVIRQAIMDASGDARGGESFNDGKTATELALEAWQWIVHRHPTCRFYCDMIGLDMEDLRDCVIDRYGAKCMAIQGRTLTKARAAAEEEHDERQRVEFGI